MSDRKAYMRDVYCRYWLTAREEIYGFGEYDKSICNLICDSVPKETELLEVAVGTGYPLADFFAKVGYSVHGIDISQDLVKKCRYLNPKIDCVVGDAEHLSWADNCFGCVYCLHSSWYFPNLNQVIDEMLRVTLPGGLVIFDIQNRNNHQIADSYRKRLRTNTIPCIVRRVAKECGKQLLRGTRLSVVTF